MEMPQAREFEVQKREEAGEAFAPPALMESRRLEKPSRPDVSICRKIPVSLRSTENDQRELRQKNTGVFPYGKRRRTLLPIHTPRRERPLLAILCYVSLLTRAAESSLLVRDLSSHRHNICNDGLSSQRLTPPRYVLALTVPFAWGPAPRSFEAAA